MTSGRRTSRMVAVVAGIGAMLLLPAAPAAADTSEPIKLELTATGGGSPELAMRVTNARTQPCVLVVTPEATLQIVSMTRDGRPVKPSFGGVGYLDGIGETLARTHRVVSGGQSVTVALGAAQPGLRAVAPTPDDRGVAAHWATADPGRYEVTAVYSVPNVPGADDQRCAGRSNTSTVAFTVAAVGQAGAQDGPGLVLWLIIGGAVLVTIGLGAFLIRRAKRGKQAAFVVALAASVAFSPVATPRAQAKVDVEFTKYTYDQNKRAELESLNEQFEGCLAEFRRSHEIVRHIMADLDNPYLLIRIVGTMDSRSPQNNKSHPFFHMGTGDVSVTYDNGAADPALYGFTVRFDPTLGGFGVKMKDGVQWNNCAQLLNVLVIAYLMLPEYEKPEECTNKPFETSLKELEMDDEVAALLVENLYRKDKKLPQRKVQGKLPDLEPEVDPCEEAKKKKKEAEEKRKKEEAEQRKKAEAEQTAEPTKPDLTPVPKDPKKKPDKPKKSDKPKKKKPSNPKKKDPGPRPSKNTGTNGDPHLYTMDGLAYDLQAVGEFVLIAAQSGDLQVQARQVPALDSRTVSINSAIAVRAGKSRVMFSIDEVEDVVVRRDGEVATPKLGDVDLGDGAALTRRPSFDELGADGYTLRWPDGSRIWVDPISTWGLRLYVDLAPGRAGQVRGLLGDFNGGPANDLTGRDGRAIEASSDGGFVEPQFERLYKEFGESWRVTKAESLFDYRPGESPDTFVDRTFPDKPVSVDTLPDADRTRAEAVCAALGVTDELLLPACVLDVATTGLASFAANAAQAQQVAEQANTAPPPDIPDRPSRSGTEISPGDTITGKVTGADRVVHRFTAQTGDVAYFQADPACDYDKTPLHWDLRKEADLDVAGGDISTGTICSDLGRIKFAESGPHVITVSYAPGVQPGAADYRFTWVRADPDQVRTLSLGEVTSGKFDIGERHIYTFQVTDGGNFTFRQDPACSDAARDRQVPWQLFPADQIQAYYGEHIGFSCAESTFAIESGGHYAIALNGIGYESGGEYSFVVQRE